MKITPEELQRLAKFVHDKSGIVLDSSKSYLVESRLLPLIRQKSFTSFGDLHNQALRNPDLANEIIDAISTNETSFFRDQKPFELLKFKIFPDVIDALSSKQGANPKSISIWSAACSTGQEAYTIAVTLHELLGGSVSQYRIKITGTDICDTAIVQSSRGCYSQFEIGRGFPRNLLNKYFVPDGLNWRVKDELRALTFFRKINLMEPFGAIGKFDIIFCRNVAIYFSMPNRKSLFERLAAQLNPHGALIIGSTESLFGVTDCFVRREYHNSVFYALK
ncbi:MAG: protein-glutamate O-methyltransferase CheR [Deltaproteobacteria bacterium]|nr:protein-glutamate O-methyltransferase CheR [Deltaproteobacteria bacterium]